MEMLNPRMGALLITKRYLKSVREKKNRHDS